MPKLLMTVKDGILLTVFKVNVLVFMFNIFSVSHVERSVLFAKTSLPLTYGCNTSLHIKFRVYLIATWYSGKSVFSLMAVLPVVSLWCQSYVEWNPWCRWCDCIDQCCGTGTAGTVTFFRSGTGTGMQYGSGTGFGSRSNIKCIKKIKNRRPTFWEIMMLLTLKRQDFVNIFCVVGKRC